MNMIKLTSLRAMYTYIASQVKTSQDKSRQVTTVYLQTQWCHIQTYNMYKEKKICIGSRVIVLQNNCSTK